MSRFTEWPSEFDNNIKRTGHKGKWGSELRLYFNATPEKLEELKSLGISVTKNNQYHSNYAYRINNNEQIWNMVMDGL